MFKFGRNSILSGHTTSFKRLDELNNQLSPKSDSGLNNHSFEIERTVKKSKESSTRTNVPPAEAKEKESKILDPQGSFLPLCYKLFFFLSIIAVSIDPLFFFLPFFNVPDTCLKIDQDLAKSVTTVRTIADAFYLLHIALQFRTAYIAPSSRVFGRGDLVKDPRRIALRYLRRFFLVDLLSVLPLPQIVVWSYRRRSSGSRVAFTKRALLIIIFVQYIPRALRILPLAGEMKRSSGVFAESAFFGAAYYLLLYMLASHTIGAFWYLMAVERQDSCWQRACVLELKNCVGEYLYCGGGAVPVNSSVLLSSCASENGPFNFGIYTSALSSGVVASNGFIKKYCYCLWWGLQNLSTLGQGLKTSTYPGEVVFSITLAIIGLILFALLIGNMQTYLQSVAIRLEEMRVRRRDSEQWMHHRLLTPDLRERVRRYDQFKWLATRGVNEESIVQSLPKDLRRDIKRHLCLALVRRVPLFDNMDERLLDAICERLKPCLFTENTYIVREGDPVDEMLFIFRGSLESVTTNGGRSGFFNHSILEEGNFCGEELLTWALDPRPALNFPSSTRTVRTLSEVESFALVAEELKFVASQFRRLHSKQVQHTFRVYSESWRTWAACFIQAAWRRHLKRKAMETRRKDDEGGSSDGAGAVSIGAAFLVSKFASSALRSVHQTRNAKTAMELMKLQKPPEPDFGNGEGD